MRVLIVDDDPNTVRLIEDSISWEEYGIDEVYSAYHGKMALDIVAQQTLDIIISDIEMPQMDGIALLESLSQEGTERPEFIFLTCHDSFTYAQKAIRHGVSDYLLKPFRPEELTAVLTNVVLKCRRKQEDWQQQQELLETKNRQNKNQDYLVQNFIRRLMNKVIEGDTEVLEQVTKRREIPFDVREKYYVIYAGVNIKHTETEKLSEAELYFIFRNLSTEVMYDRVDAPTVVESNLPPFYVLVILIKESFCSRMQLEERCQRLIHVAEQYLRMQISCVISQPVYPTNFGEVRKKMDTLFSQKVTYQSKIILAEAEEESGQVASGIVIQDMIRYLREQKKTDLIVCIRNLLKRYEADSLLNAERMRAIHHDIMQVFYGYLFENHIQAYNLFQDDTSRMLHDAAEYTPMDMIRYVNYMYDCTVRQIELLKESESVVEKVKKYIEQHFSDNIGRDEIAASVLLAPNYLSKLFHEETDMTLREYINYCRVEEAKKLLATTNISITTIALQVGFENIPYFSTVFKKYCGMAPAAWKSKLEHV